MHRVLLSLFMMFVHRLIERWLKESNLVGWLEKRGHVTVPGW